MINEYYATKYCCEDLSLIENYDLAVADTTQTWEIHHRGEILPCGRFSRAYLKKFGLYYKRPAAELIFLTPAEHNSMHFKGIQLSEEHKKALSEAHKGVQIGPMSEATKKAISDAKKGIPLSEKHRAKLSKKILQFTKSGEFIKEWPSAREAERVLGISQSSICSCCNRIRKSAGGYVWRYDALGYYDIKFIKMVAPGEHI